MNITTKTAHSSMELHRIMNDLKNANFELTDSYGCTWEYTNEKIECVVLLTLSDLN